MVKILMLPNGRYAPVFVCDGCGLTIEDASMGMEVSLDVDGPHEPGESATAYHIHKGECDEIFQKKHGEASGSTELTTHIARLMLNSGIKPDQLTKYIEDADRFDEL